MPPPSKPGERQKLFKNQDKDTEVSDFFPPCLCYAAIDFTYFEIKIVKALPDSYLFYSDLYF